VDEPIILALIGLAVVGLMATLLIMRRQRKSGEAEAESQYSVSTEGAKRCPKCGMGNMWTDSTCISCGRPLRG
jgi:prepilin signal peptidase PulO-like enzyme (type II secretory pathway)